MLVLVIHYKSIKKDKFLLILQQIMRDNVN